MKNVVPAPFPFRTRSCRREYLRRSRALRQAETGALADRLGGEAGREDALSDFGGIPEPVSAIAISTESPSSRVLTVIVPHPDGLRRVHDEIQEHLVQQTRIAFDFRQIGEFCDYSDRRRNTHPLSLIVFSNTLMDVDLRRSLSFTRAKVFRLRMTA